MMAQLSNSVHSHSKFSDSSVLIFSGVKSIEFMDNTNFPNDQINEIVVDEAGSALSFKLFADSISSSGKNIESYVAIVADSVRVSVPTATN